MFFGQPDLCLGLKSIENGCGKVGIIKLLFIGGNRLASFCGGVLRIRNLLAIKNVAGPLGTHDGYFRRRPGHDIVCPEMIKLS